MLRLPPRTPRRALPGLAPRSLISRRRLLPHAALAGSAGALLLFAGAAPAAAEPWITGTASNQASIIAQLFWFTLVLAGIVFVLVEGLILYSSIRFRRRAPIGVSEPPQIHGNTRLEVMWAIVPALLLIGLFGVTVLRMGELSDVPTNGVHVKVTAHQFAWTFSYTDDNFQTTNDLHVPVGTPVIFDVTSTDVIHSFWVPDLNGKMDAVPGRDNQTWFQADTAGTYRGVCAELCGSGHDNMMFTVTAVSQADYQTWVQQQKGGGQAAAGGTSNGGDPAAGAKLIAQEPCGGCHVIPGIQGAVGTIGPSLAGVATRTKIAGGAITVSGPDDLKKWIMNAPAEKPGTDMPNMNINDADATNIVAYLETLK